MGRTAEQILKDRREADKRRFARWKERQEQKGKRHISGMISAEAYDLLSRERDQTGESVSSIVERALIGFYGVSVEPQPEPEPITHKETQETLTLPLVDAEPEQTPDIPYDDQDKYFEVLIELMKKQKKAGFDGMQAIKNLNAMGIKYLTGKQLSSAIFRQMKKRGFDYKIWNCS